MKIFVLSADKIEATVYRDDYVILCMENGYHVYNPLGIKYTDDPFDSEDGAKQWVDSEIATQNGQKVLN